MQKSLKQLEAEAATMERAWLAAEAARKASENVLAFDASAYRASTYWHSEYVKALRALAAAIEVARG